MTHRDFVTPGKSPLTTPSKLSLEDHERQEDFTLDEMVGHLKRLLDEGVLMHPDCGLCSATARALGAMIR